MTASICGGYNASYRSSAPQHNLVLATGKRPFVGFHYALEGGSVPVLSDVAIAMASKLANAIKDTARTELLLTEDYGCLEADAGQVTVQYNQKQIADNVDITSAAKHFTLNLDFGPYYIKYTRNGRHLVLGGKKGHVAALDWITKN